MDDKTAEALKKRQDRVKSEIARLRIQKEALSAQVAQTEAQRDLAQELTIAYKLESSELEESLKQDLQSRAVLVGLKKEVKAFVDETSLAVKKQRIQTQLYKSACQGPLWEAEGPDDEEVLELVEAQLKTYDMQANFIDKAAELTYRAHCEELQLIRLDTRKLLKDLEEAREGHLKDLTELQTRRRALPPPRQPKAGRSRIVKTVSL